MERIIKLEAGYDKRDPDPNKNYGIHGVNLRMVLKGSKGAVQFLLYTGWMVPSARETGGYSETAKYIPADLGYHSLMPMRDSDTPMSEPCEFLDGKPCYYDGSSLAAGRIFNVLTEEGDEGVWRELTAYYAEIFGTAV